ncbi:MAG: HNH endonuclease [Dissulfurimicrobium sp.]|uniref:HNH endonuclease n=1 Tax=Dissulfurimicrobium TaxID=1769732 RepID=UPI001EDA20C9|nr:HNH endonuclease [Dissulfurimicrobium hydrothermale]UKL14077.1 HNH endonuclease [Dissulfurimicrobium hydrothermale]
MFLFDLTEEDVRKEKNKAKELRNSKWWRNKRARGECYYCRRNVGPQNLTMDHIVPLARGGKSIKVNLVPACRECNSKKKYLLPMEWEGYLEGLNKSIGKGS